MLAVRREFAGEPPAGNKYEQFLAVLREYERYICSCVLPVTIDDEMQAS